MTNDALPQGTLIADRFRIERPIGEGGMGAVYEATQLNLNRRVALKIILATHASKQGARKRFEREARVASALKHANAVEIYDFGEHEDTMYLAMEFLQGDSLRSIVDLNKPHLSVHRVSQIVADIADVLVAAEQINLTHRDLKPENVFLDVSRNSIERTVVVDFGLAFIQEDELSGRMTREGVVTGTPDYMSPEQARGVSINPAADIYALGCMMYEMLCSAPPFDGDAAIIMSRHLFVAPTSLREKFPQLNIPGAVDELVLRMLAKSPEDRPSPRTIRDALRNIDPAAPERASGQSRDGQLIGRAARMVSQRPLTEEGAQSDISTDELSVELAVASIGQFPADFELALAANGIQLSPMSTADESPPSNALAIFAPEADPETVQALTQTGLPIVGGADVSDVDRLAAMLRAGAAEVVIRPCVAEDVARKVRRAIRKASRK